MISRNDKSAERVRFYITIINTNLEKISKLWTNFQRKNIQSSKMLITYEKFMKLVLNDSTFKLNNKVDLNEMEEVKKNPILSEFISFIKEGNNYILASASSDDIGRIISTNQGTARLFGYLKQDLLSKNIHDLIPNIMKAAHYKMIINSIQSEKSKIVREFVRRFSLGLHFNQYIIPLNFSTSILIGYNEVYLVAFVRSNYSDVARKMCCHILTNTNFEIQNISSEMISLFGINNNNFKSKRGSLDITFLIKEMGNIKMNPQVIEDYKYSNILYNKKRIVINDTGDLFDCLVKNSERNKKVKIGENEKHCLAKKTQVINQRNKQRLMYTDFFFSVDQLKINNNHIGYHIMLEPIKDEEFTEIPRLNYVNNISYYSITKGKFYDPNIVSKTNLLSIADNAHNKKDKRKTTVNTIEGFLKYHGIKDYSHKVTFRVVDLTNRPHKLEIPKPKINESLYAWQNYYNNLDKYGDNESNDPDIQREETVAVYSESDSFLNFKGIDGWEIVTKKLHKNKLPLQISFIAYFSIIFFIVQILLASLFYVKISNSYKYIHDIANLKNLTAIQSKYINEFMENIEYVFKYNDYILGYPSENSKEQITNNFTIANETIYSSIDKLLETSNSMRLDETILDETFLINKNYTYYLSTESIEAISLKLNYAEFVTHLINKIITNARIYQKDVYTRNHTEYVLLHINNMNVFQTSTLAIIFRVTTALNDNLLDIESKLKLYLLISVVFIFPCLLLYFSAVEINKTLLEYIDLFFTIPPKISWKYYTTCEIMYISLINSKGEDSTNEEMRNEYDSSNSDDEIGNTEAEIQSRRKIEQTINKRSQEEKTLKSSQSYIILKLVAMLYFMVSISTYLYNYLVYSNYKKETLSLNESSKVFFDINIYLFALKFNLNEKMYFTNRKIMGMDNYKSLNTVYQNITDSLSDINQILISNRVDGKILLDQVYQELNFNGLCYVTGVISTSEFNKELNTVQNIENLCEGIPTFYSGFTNLAFFTANEYVSKFEEFNKHIKHVESPTSNSNRNLQVRSEVKDDFSKFYFSLESKIYNKIKNIHDLVTETIFITFKITVKKIISNISSERMNLLISTVIYSLLIFLFFVQGYLFYLKTAIQNILYTKSTFLLIDSEDVKTIKPIMTFLNEEINKTNSS